MQKQNYEPIELPTKVRVIFETDKKSTIRVWNAIYNGLPCYCVEHKPTGHMEICSPSYNRSGKRMAVGVHTGKGNSITMNLSRFAGLFGKYFEKYKSGCNPIASFVHDLPKLTAETPEQFDHINACKFNNCLANLFPTDGVVNQRKSNSYRKFQTAGIKAVAVANGRGEICIEYPTLVKTKIYYKCKDAEDFLDWQKVFLGMDKLTGNTRVIDWKNRCMCWVKNIFSKPTGEASIEEKRCEILEWCMDRDRVLSLEESTAVKYRDYTRSGVRQFSPQIVPNAVGESVAHIADGELEFFGQKLPKGAVVEITNLGKADGGGVTVG